MTARETILLIAIGLVGWLGGGCRRDVPRFPNEPSKYRHVRESDLCWGLSVFSEPSGSSYEGSVIDGAQQYLDPGTGKRMPAVRLMTFVNQRRIDRWVRRDHLVRWYVYREDPYINNCHYWLDRRDPVKPDGSEVPAD
jgi:hypothetical protein